MLDEARKTFRTSTEEQWNKVHLVRPVHGNLDGIGQGGQHSVSSSSSGSGRERFPSSKEGAIRIVRVFRMGKWLGED